MTREPRMSQNADMPELIRRMLEKNDEAGVDPHSLQGTLMRGMNFAQLLYQAFASEKPVVWINVFTPPELIFACDCVPFWMDGAGGFSGWMEMNEVFEFADAVLPSRDVCTFLRAAVGGVGTGLFPQPDVVVCTSHLCESAPKVAGITARHYGAGFHLLDVPGIPSAEAISYVAGQLERLASSLCALSGTRFDRTRLQNAIWLSNRARRHFLWVAEARKRIPALVTGSQFVGFGLVYPWGTEDGVAIAETMREEISQRMSDNVSAVAAGERNRLMWIHLRPVFETDIMNHIEETLRSVIVVDVLGEVWWPELNVDSPFEALALKIFSNPELQQMEKKIQRLVDLAARYGVDGVVHFLQWGCRWNYGQSAIFKKALTDAGLPYLALDGDAVDKRSAPHGQMLTRLEAFLELLETNGPRRRATRNTQGESRSDLPFPAIRLS